MLSTIAHTSGDSQTCYERCLRACAIFIFRWCSTRRACELFYRLVCMSWFSLLDQDIYIFPYRPVVCQREIYQRKAVYSISNWNSVWFSVTRGRHLFNSCCLIVSGAEFMGKLSLSVLPLHHYYCHLCRLMMTSSVKAHFRLFRTYLDFITIIISNYLPFQALEALLEESPGAFGPFFDQVCVKCRFSR